MPEGDGSELLSIAEVAKLLGVSVATLRRWDRAGVLPAQRDPGSNHRRYLRGAVDQLRAMLERSRRAHAGRLPCPRDRFFGRERELAAVDGVFAGGARLVTLFGPPGIGKTRLALEFARRAEPQVVFADAGAAAGEHELCAMLAVALAVSSSGGDAAAEIARAIDARPRRLVVLDNFEHLVSDAAGTLASWLESTRTARFLVTSRALLRIAGERPIEVGPLGLPAADDDVWHSEAGALFADRAPGVRPSYAPNDADAAPVAGIVRRLEGNPLAIELAAAGIGIRTASELCARLAEGIASLASPRRDAPARHTSLRAAVDHSFAMLSLRERTVLAQVSVFAGGFSLAAAEAVVDPPAPGDRATAGVIEALREKSLVRMFEVGAPPSIRFALYETVRELAGDLVDPGARVRAAARHADTLLAAAEAWLDELALGASVDPVDRLAGELENLLAVHQSAVARGATGAETALRAALALDPVLADRGPASLRHQVLSSALAAIDRAEVEPALRGRGIEAWAAAQRRVGDLGGAATAYDSALELARAAGLGTLERGALEGLGSVCAMRGERPRARQLLEAARALSEAAGDVRGEARAWNLLGLLAKAEDDLTQAERSFELAVDLFRGVGDLRGEGQVLSNLGSLRLQLDRGDPIGELRRAVEIAQAFGDRRLEAHALGNLANALHDRGQVDGSRATYRRALACLAHVSDRIARAICIGNLALLDWESGDATAARAGLDRAYREVTAIGHRRAEAFFLALLGGVEAALDRVEAAEHRFEQARAIAGAPSPSAGAVTELLAAQIDLSVARAAERAGDVERARAVRDRVAALAREQAAARAATSEDVRTTLRLLEARLAADTRGQLSRLAVDRGGRWFRVGSTMKVDISQRRPLRRILLTLVERRIESPGAEVPRHELIAAGWPGERFVAATGSQRLWVAISTLRKLGLRDLLVHREDGYLVEPAAACAWEEES